MFCQCGREVFSGDSFCPGCGKSIQSAPSPSLPPPSASRRPRKKGRLWNFHTLNWVGHCPTCHLAHTCETARCPNDDAPLVMAFNCSRWNFIQFPMQTAHLHCGNNCGYTTTAFQCTNDGTVVTGQFIEFRPPLIRVVQHNATHILILMIAFCLALPFLFAVEEYVRNHLTGGDPKKVEDDSQGFALMALLTFGLFAASMKFMYNIFYYEWLWKFVRTFDLDMVRRVPPPPQHQAREPYRKD